MTNYSAQQENLVEALSRCPSLQTTEGYEDVLGRLRHEIKTSIRKHGTIKQILLKTVETCSDYSEGIDELVQAVAFFDKGRDQFVAVQQCASALKAALERERAGGRITPTRASGGSAVAQLEAGYNHGLKRREPSPEPEAHVERLSIPAILAYNLRRLIDYLLPALHRWLTEHRFLAEPPGYYQVNDYLRRFQVEMEHLNAYYLPLEAKPLWENPIIPLGLPATLQSGYLRKVRQSIRRVMNDNIGGYQTTARLAVVNRRSKVIKDILREILSSRDPLILLGDPGTGKSMTLREAGKILAEEGLRRVYPRVAVYLRLGDFEPEGQTDVSSVRSFVLNALPSELRALFDPFLQQHRLVILFDGMDEMSREHYGKAVKALSDFAGSYSRHVKCIFSCRINDFSPTFRHRQLVLVPFNRQQIRSFVEGHFGRTPPGRQVRLDNKIWTPKQITTYLLTSDLASELAEQITNPMILYLVCAFISAKETWPKSRAQLFESFFEYSYQRYQAQHSDPKHNLLGKGTAFVYWQRIAFLITLANKGAWIALTRDLLECRIEAFGRVIDEGRHCGVLVLDDSPTELEESYELNEDSSERRLRFTHHRFQEYFAACYLSDKSLAIDWPEVIDQPRWQETILYHAAMTHQCPAIELLVNSATEADFDSKHNEAHESESNEMKVGDNRSYTERILADRIELASRVVREIGRDNIGQRLWDSLLAAIRQFSTAGNPSSQVRMLWAAWNLPGVDLFDLLGYQLKSETAWVRDQALIVLTQFDPRRRGSTANLAFEIGLSLASGEFLFRGMAYFRAVGSARHFSAWLSLVQAVVISLIYILFSVGIVVVGYSQLAKALPVYQIPYFFYCYPLVTALASAFMIRLGERQLGTAVCLPAGILFPLPLFALALLEGSLKAAKEGFGIILATSFVWVVLSAIAHLVLVTGYIVFTLGRLPKNRSLADIYRTLVDSYRSLFKNLGIPSTVMLGILSGQAVLTLLLLHSELFRTFVTHFFVGVPDLTYLGRHVLLPFSPQTNNAVSVGLLVAVVVFYFSPLLNKQTFLERLRFLFKENGQMLILLAVLLIFTIGLWSVTGQYSWNWLEGHGFTQWTSYIILASVALVVTVLSLLALGLAWRLSVMHWEIRTARRDPQKWRAQFERRDLYRQAKLLHSTNHQLLGLSARDFSSMLTQLENIVQGEPARGLYWSTRHQLEQILRQEEVC
jgi:hypothetical protein